MFFGRIGLFFVIAVGVYHVYLVIMVTCVFLLDKLAYFVDTCVQSTTSQQEKQQSHSNKEISKQR
jgi:hypothetical protein